ncbi:hypothetical protein [Pelomonas cellulosilytica]|uniref:HTH cro/C1-type domain-containing protein n=1 Tax=Pelomonas cellulosilytica TaxID=2906762 RepID=A0ABS8XWC2_9BURK|nr:hypothetical protein [Pelomonas sp. P8]MCE4555013.1 hypothetical protein [Pelomonas sp. P8]
MINTLLDAAKDKTGSDYKTAQLLGVPFQLISDWRGARKNPQPEDHALVAALAGLDAEEALVRAIIEKHRDKPKGERLLSALGNVLRRTGEVVTLGFFASVVWGLIPGGSAPASAKTMTAEVATMCIM